MTQFYLGAFLFFRTRARTTRISYKQGLKTVARTTRISYKQGLKTGVVTHVSKLRLKAQKETWG